MAERQTAAELERRGITLINSWRADWCKFAYEALGVNLDEEQKAILRSVQCNRRTSVVSGTARGKDFVSACAAICFLYLTPRWEINAQGQMMMVENTKVALTAPTDRQVKNIMMPEISRLYNRARSKGILLAGKLNAYDIRTDNEEWFLTGFKADEHNHEAWSGFHAVHTMFVVTEATGISDNTFSAIEGNLQGDSRMLIVFNPNNSTGYAAKSQYEARWAKFRLNSLSAPNVLHHKIVVPGQVDYEWVVDKLHQWCSKISEQEVSEQFDDFKFEGQWYRPEDLFRVKILGKFPKVSEDTLIPYEWIELANKNWEIIHSANFLPAVPCRLGVDVAGMGRDNSVLCPRYGNYVPEFQVHQSTGHADHMHVAGMTAVYLKKKGTKAFIDTIGEGAGVYSRLLEEGYSNAISCKFSEGAAGLHDVTGEYEFANMRAYLYWALRDWLNPKNETGAALPPCDILKEEAKEIKWKFLSNGKIMIESKEDIKKRLKRSTDYIDSLVNTFYPYNEISINEDELFNDFM